MLGGGSRTSRVVSAGPREGGQRNCWAGAKEAMSGVTAARLCPASAGGLHALVETRPGERRVCACLARSLVSCSSSPAWRLSYRSRKTASPEGAADPSWRQGRVERGRGGPRLSVSLAARSSSPVVKRAASRPVPGSTSPAGAPVSGNGSHGLPCPVRKLNWFGDMDEKSNPGTLSESSECLFSFGVIADIQYADLDDGYNFQGSRRRYYRQSLLHLQGAIEEWNNESSRPCCVLQLGDVIDGYNAQYRASEKALELVMNTFATLKVPVHHTWGNHEFYNFSRDYLTCSKLNTKSLEDRIVHHPETVPSESYYAYHFVPFPTFRFILLDAYDLSVLGVDESSPKYQQCMKILREHNPNTELNSSQGLSEPQFVQFNGGFSQEQLTWLNEVLTFSDTNQEKVVIVSHLPIYPEASDSVCLAWNYRDALTVIWSHQCVVCFFAGHTHDGGYAEDPFGVHHVNLEGIIETAPNSQAFGTVYVYPDKMMLKGRGRVPDRVMNYRKEKALHL